MQSYPDALMGQPAPRRYEVLFKLAAGGMATVYLGYLRGGLGFRQVVAIKRPHPHLLDDPAFRQSFVAEAHLACRIHHANVVDVRDIDVNDASIDLVMDYVEGASLSRLLDAAARGLKPLPPSVALRIALDACAGLHAAHEATDETGRPLHLVHRDVSPQNILIGMDGVSRVTDFGIAKCVVGGGVTTQQGTLKGKLAYMSPEYLLTQKIDRRADLFAMGAVIWESLMGQRLFTGENEPDTINRVLNEPAPLLSALPQPIADVLDPVLARCVAKNPAYRFPSALAIVAALEDAAQSCGLRPNHREVAAFMNEVMGEELQRRRTKLQDRLANRVTAFPADSPDRPLPPDPRAASAASASGPNANLPDAYSGIHGSAISLVHPRPKASRWWIVPVAIALLGAAAASAWTVRHFAFSPPVASSGPVASAPQPQTSLFVETPPVQPAPVPCASASVSAPDSSPPAPTRPAPRSTPAPVVTPKGPPPNPY